MTAWELGDAVDTVVELDYPRKDGTTLREHLESWSKQSGKQDPRLDPPRIPGVLSYLWGWFWDIIQGKGDAGWWVTLQAWQQATGNTLTGTEAEILRMIYQKYDKAVFKKLKEEK